ncbi:MAG: hypothetical protein IPM55_21360 [Acidobacteria bacterium]|nr:hypothetical protein [Acidobacteriota bacterium]
MPENNEQSDIQIAWIKYVKSVQILLVPQVDDRPFDQYLAFRDSVLALVLSQRFLKELNEGWGLPDTTLPETTSPTEIRQVLLQEIQAFPLAVEVAQATQKPEESKAWWSKMLSRASTVSGSVKDIVDNLPPYAKHSLTLFKELIDLFKGKD